MASRRRVRASRSLRRSPRVEALSFGQLAATLVLIIVVGSAGLVALNWDVRPSGLFTAPVSALDNYPACNQCLNDFTGFSCDTLAPGDNNFEVLSSACATAYTSCAAAGACPLLSCGNGVCNLEEGESAQNCAVDCR